VNGDFSATLAVTGSDINRNPISFAPDAPPTNGLISSFDPVTGAFTYTPAHAYSGADSFTFKVSDGRTNSSPAVVALNVQAPADANGNGLPDYWESIFGLGDPLGDDDTDGVSNEREYVANTNPTNSASALRMTSVSRNESGHFTLTWASVGGTRYRVQFRDADPAGPFTDIVRPATAEIDGAPSGVAGSLAFTDDFTLTGGAPPSGSRLYRIQVIR